VRGSGFFSYGCDITIYFTEVTGASTTLKTLSPHASFKATVSIPAGAAVGPGTVHAWQERFLGRLCHAGGALSAQATFTVTSQGKWLW
jgi:hypothetical protein